MAIHSSILFFFFFFSLRKSFILQVKVWKSNKNNIGNKIVKWDIFCD